MDLGQAHSTQRRILSDGERKIMGDMRLKTETINDALASRPPVASKFRVCRTAHLAVILRSSKYVTESAFVQRPTLPASLKVVGTNNCIRSDCARVGSCNRNWESCNVNGSNGRLPARLPVTGIGMEAFLCGFRKSACSFAAHLVASTLSGPPLVTMVQAGDLRHCDHSSHRWRLDRARDRRIFVQSQMRPRSRVIFEIRSQNTAQAALVEGKHVVEALAPDGANQPFNECILPRRARSREDFVNAHGTCCRMEPFSVA